MQLGEKIRAARKAKHLSQEELAKKLFISRSALAKWELDRTMPDIHMLQKLSAILDVSIEHLTGDAPLPLTKTVPKAVYDAPHPKKSPASDTAENIAHQRLLCRVFTAMFFILLNNQYVNWFHSNRALPLELIPAFVGYFLLLPVTSRLLTGVHRVLLQGFLLTGTLASLGGFITVLCGNKTGAFPILNLLGHAAALLTLFLFAAERRKERDLSIGIFWPVCTGCLLLMDLWLLLFCGLSLQNKFIYHGANLRLLPTILMLLELWRLHPMYDATFQDSVF